MPAAKQSMVQMACISMERRLPLGHTAYNWSLKHVSTTFVAVVTLGEPVGSAALALLIFGETFAPLQGAGFVMLLTGIYLSARGEGRTKPAPQ